MSKFGQLEDDADGLINKSPYCPDQRVTILSSVVEGEHGPQCDVYPAFAGEVPEDNLGYLHGEPKGKK